MKKNRFKISILLFALIWFCNEANAQSKKAINKQLFLELYTINTTYDSIQTEWKSKLKEENHINHKANNLRFAIAEKKSEENKLRDEIKWSYQILTEMNFDGNAVVPISEVNALISPIKDMDYLKEVPSNEQSVNLEKVPGLQDLTDLKIKVQNQLMQQKIGEYASANKKNSDLLSQEQVKIDNAIKLNEQRGKILDDYIIFNKTLREKANLLNSKCSEIREKRAEEERLKAEKERIALEKAKSKKSTKSKFYPPPIEVEEIEYELLEPTHYQINVTDKSGDIMPPELIAPPIEDAVFDIVEEEAEFPGGRVAMMEYIKKNLKYPESALELEISGKAYLKFVVSETGSISNVKVQKGVPDCPECDQEAIRLIQNMPNWKPAKSNNKPVKTYFTMPIPFTPK